MISFFFFTKPSYQSEHYIDYNEEELHFYIEKNKKIIDQLETNSLKELPFQQLLQGILEGVYPYQLLIRYQDNLSSYTVIKSTVSYTYILGQPTRDQLNTIITELINYKDLIIICDESLHKNFIQHEFTIQPRIELEYPLDCKKYKNNIPSGYTFQELNIT